MNHDTNREDLIGLGRVIVDQNGVGWFGCVYRPIQPHRICISCGAKPDPYGNLPCPCGQREESC
ncbi:hypothetical protein SAMN05216466_107104 [Paraburkholderia phenazinium]|uniref:Uncharacterized protein n=1 Tax=Paraburkholderia phenazinium TaxID=60549 RepID=A0A1G7ZQ28_9BURK|nr:hypothetical protein SAMN05216466_107104 [Paraburkholderia phenazinium]